MESLENGLKELLEKQMPGAQAKLTIKRLEEADQMEKELEKVKKILSETQSNYKVEHQERVRLESSIKKVHDQAKVNEKVHEELSILKINLEEQGRGLELNLLRKELEMTKSSKEDLFSLTGLIFKNTVVSESIIRNSRKSGNTTFEDDKYGNQMPVFRPDGHNDSVEETKIQSTHKEGDAPSTAVE